MKQRYPDVQVRETDRLPPGILGGVDHEKRIIWLARGLTPVQRTCTLAYEAAQLQQGPTPVDPCMAAAHRRAAEDWAAQMLISPEVFVEAFTVASDLPGLAEHAGVDVQTFRARIRGASDEDQDRALDAIRSLRATA